MTLVLDLAPATERRLAELAASNGTTLEAFAKQVLEREAHDGQSLPLFAQGNVPEAEVERLLDELAEGLPPLPTLPADFSRADIYGEHP